jgi:CrcB protein
MDTAFEEAAAMASERRAKLIESMRARRSGMPSPKTADATHTIKLASSGRPAAAILWKNMLALKRQWTMSTLARPVIIALFLSYTVFRTMHDPAKIVAVVAGYLAFKGEASQPWRLFLMTGILGGYTTFSAFSLDAALLYEKGEIGLAVLYVVGSVVLSIVGLFAGLALVRHLA